MRRLRALIEAAGLRIEHEQLHLIGSVRRLPRAAGAWLRDSPLTQDIVIGNLEFVMTAAR